jgi:hypothetical protein
MSTRRGSLSSVAINKDADSLAGSAVPKRGEMYIWHTERILNQQRRQLGKGGRRAHRPHS